MILLYHLLFPDNTPPDAWNAGKIIRLADFKKQVLWLKKLFRIVPLAEYMQQKPAAHGWTAALTFDDGYRSTFELASAFLLEEGVPATFFACTSHLEDGQLLWFVYFNALCSEKAYREIIMDGKKYPLTSEKFCFQAWRTLIGLARASGDAIAFASHFARDYPLPEEITRKYLGLSESQIRLAGEGQLLQVGGHTHRHPYLDQLPYDRQLEEMQVNKHILESISGTPVRTFAYTGGIYDAESLAAVRQAGFEAAFAVRTRRLGSDGRYEIPRTDIYSASMLKFKLKASRLVDLARKFRRGAGKA